MRYIIFVFCNACTFVMGLRHLELGSWLSFGVDICLAFVEWMFLSLFLITPTLLILDCLSGSWGSVCGPLSHSANWGIRKCLCSVSDHANKPSIVRADPGGISSEVITGT